MSIINSVTISLLLFALIHGAICIPVELIKRNVLISVIETCTQAHFYLFSLHFCKINLPDVLKKPLKKPLCCLLFHHSRHKHGELITAEPKNHILVTA